MRSGERIAAELDRGLAHVLEAAMRRRLVCEALEGLPAEVGRELISHVLMRPARSDTGFDLLRETLHTTVQTSARDAEHSTLGYTLRRDLYEAAAHEGDEPVMRLLRSAAARPDKGLDEARLPPDLDEIPLGRRRSLAKGEDRHQLERLALDPDPLVTRHLLRNPRLREEDVLRIAARRPVPASTLREVDASPRWSQRSRIRSALARNPSCPGDLAAKLVASMPRADLRAMRSDPDLPDETRDFVSAEWERRNRR